MTEYGVFFQINNTRVSYAYDRSQLCLGTIIHVQFDDQGNALSFSPHPSRDSIPYTVVWISAPKWLVDLEPGFRIPEEPVDLVSSLLSGLMDKPDVVLALETAAKDIRLEYLYSANELDRSRVSTIASVADRLRLVSHLWHNLEQFDAYQYEPLATYLLLTCFERLGQPSDWMDFGTWLRASRKQGERESIYRMTKDTEPAEAAATMYEWYSRIYGVRSAFFGFVNLVLPDRARAELLSCIAIEEIAHPPNLDQRRMWTDDERLAYLFRLRNSFTHRLRGIRGVGKHLFPEHLRHEPTWRVAEQRIEDQKWIVVYVRNWPDIVESTVRIGLSAYLKLILRESNRSDPE